MKHRFIASLLVLVLLSGCGVEAPIETTQICVPTETTAVIEPTTEPTEITVATEVTEVTEPTVETTEATEPTEVTEATEPVNLQYIGRFGLTAYCACSKCCGQSADGITATGAVATQGRTIAVDPTVIPYGTEVVINGHTYVAEDCGGSIKENRIDIYFDDHEEAWAFGLQYADVYIVGS